MPAGTPAAPRFSGRALNIFQHSPTARRSSGRPDNQAAPLTFFSIPSSRKDHGPGQSLKPAGRRHPFFMALSNCSFSLPDRMHYLPFLRALSRFLSAPHCLLCRLLILRIATQPRRQGRPFLRLPASSLLPSAPGASLSLFHAHPFTQSGHMSE